MTIGTTMFKKLAIEAKEITLRELHSIGIKDDFRLHCSKQKTRIIGQYKGTSQFSPKGIIFRLFPSIVDVVKEEIQKDKDIFGYDKDLPTEVLRGMVDTLIHEYGHVIAELLKWRCPKLYAYIIDTWGNEEEYAEDFMRLLRNNDSDLSEEHHIKIIDAFKTELL
jgi:hypothetical protein